MFVILNTTDGKFIGREVDYDEAKNIIVLPDNESVNIYKKMKVDEGITRLSNSNYCIDITEVR